MSEQKQKKEIEYQKGIMPNLLSGFYEQEMKRRQDASLHAIFKELRIDFNKISFLPETMLMLIDELIRHRNRLQKDNTIYRKSSDELNEDFIANLKKLKYKLKKIVLEEKNMNEKKKLWIEKTLSDLPFVNWDRFLDLRFEENRVLHVFGWIKREDSYKDFVSLEFDVVNQKVFFIATSSKKYSKRIAEILGCSDHADCQRIEDFFKIENMIKLKERECEQKQKKEELEIIRMKNIYATQMEAYQIDLAKASKGYSYWNHKLKEFYEKEKEVKE